MKIVTHDSSFHTDDICAVATLLLVLGDAEVIRSRDTEVYKTADYLVDTGMKYDPAHHFFDHHQPEGAGVRKNGIPYASFGLVWKEFGEQLAGGKKEAELFDKRLVQAVDAHDNGVTTVEYKFEGVEEYHLGDFFNSFVDSRDPDHIYATFMYLVGIAKDLITREIAITKRLVVDHDKIASFYNESDDKRLVVMSEDLRGWKDFIRGKPEVLYVIYPRPDGKWTLATASIHDNHYTPRKRLPVGWAGLTDEELQKSSGVSDATFCHRNLFMCAARSKEGAIKLAEIALNA